MIPFYGAEEMFRRDQIIFWGLTIFAIVWWGFQFIKLPGAFNELQNCISDLGKGKSFLPLVMQVFFLFFWWLIPLIPIILLWDGPYGRMFTYLTR